MPDPRTVACSGEGGAWYKHAPDGQTIGVNSQYLLLNKKPWLPVMGEFHYGRVPQEDWGTEILKMKAGGVQIISTYIICIHHEEIEGQFDWSGRRDLHAFVALCAAVLRLEAAQSRFLQETARREAGQRS